jgi:hypothetical protein
VRHPALRGVQRARESPEDVAAVAHERGGRHVRRERHRAGRLAHRDGEMRAPLGDELLGEWLSRLQEVAMPAPEGGDGVGQRQRALDAHRARVDAVRAEHGEQALPRGRGLGEVHDGLADEVAPAKVRPALAREQEESVARVHLGEVHEKGPATVGNVEAAHDAAQRDLRVAVHERGGRRVARARRDHVDLEALGAEVAAVEGHELRGVEHGSERLVDREASRAAHGGAV